MSAGTDICGPDVQRPLPPLRKFAAPAESPSTYTTDIVLRLQRRIARQYRNGVPQRFYSIREVADHFRIPRIAVARVFDKLKAEGLLTSCWGSKTILQPRHIDQDLRFRGLVAQLGSMDTFKVDRAYQTLVMDVSDELWHRGFACRISLYENAEADEPEYFDQILAKRPDLIIWMPPTSRASLLSQQLLNCGIRVLRGATTAEISKQLTSCGG